MKKRVVSFLLSLAMFLPAVLNLAPAQAAELENSANLEEMSQEEAKPVVDENNIAHLPVKMGGKIVEEELEFELKDLKGESIFITSKNGVLSFPVEKYNEYMLIIRDEENYQYYSTYIYAVPDPDNKENLILRNDYSVDNIVREIHLKPTSSGNLKRTVIIVGDEYLSEDIDFILENSDGESIEIRTEKSLLTLPIEHEGEYTLSLKDNEKYRMNDIDFIATKVSSHDGKEAFYRLLTPDYETWYFDHITIRSKSENEKIVSLPVKIGEEIVTEELDFELRVSPYETIKLKSKDGQVSFPVEKFRTYTITMYNTHKYEEIYMEVYVDIDPEDSNDLIFRRENYPPDIINEIQLKAKIDESLTMLPINILQNRVYDEVEFVLEDSKGDITEIKSRDGYIGLRLEDNENYSLRLKDGSKFEMQNISFKAEFIRAYVEDFSLLLAPSYKESINEIQLTIKGESAKLPVKFENEIVSEDLNFEFVDNYGYHHKMKSRGGEISLPLEKFHNYRILIKDHQDFYLDLPVYAVPDPNNRDMLILRKSDNPTEIVKEIQLEPIKNLNIVKLPVKIDGKSLNEEVKFILKELNGESSEIISKNSWISFYVEDAKEYRLSLADDSKYNMQDIEFAAVEDKVIYNSGRFTLVLTPYYKLELKEIQLTDKEDNKQDQESENPSKDPEKDPETPDKETDKPGQDTDKPIEDSNKPGGDSNVQGEKPTQQPEIIEQDKSEEGSDKSEDKAEENAKDDKPEDDKPEIFENAKLDRIAGANRYKTAVELSKNNFKSADTVVLVNGTKEADALAASVLAEKENAPILLITKEKTPDEVRDEITRLGAKKIVMIGGEASIIDEAIDGLNLETERIAGENRYETAVKIAERAGKTKRLVVANGLSLVDALTASGLASTEDRGIILVDEKEIPESARSVINNAEDILIVGGKNSVDIGIKADRLAGEDRYETAVKIAERAFPDAKKVGLANATAYTDALVFGAVSAKLETPILLTEKDKLSEQTRAYLEKHKPETIFVLGGENSINLENFK